VAARLEPELLEWKFTELTSAIAGAFGRVEPRKAATGYLRGLLSEIPVRPAGTWANTPGIRPRM
jgi:hypothetical protein